MKIKLTSKIVSSGVNLTFLIMVMSYSIQDLLKFSVNIGICYRTY